MTSTNAAYTKQAFLFCFTNIVYSIHLKEWKRTFQNSFVSVLLACNYHLYKVIFFFLVKLFEATKNPLLSKETGDLKGTYAFETII